MKKRLPYLIFIFFILSSLSVFSQKSSKKKNNDKGFDIFFNAGMYLGNKNNANYYMGYPEKDSKYGDPDIREFLPSPYNTFLWDRITELISDNNHGIIISDRKDLYYYGSSDMKYNLAFGFGVGIRYRFSESFGISFLFSQTRLTAEGVGTIVAANSTRPNKPDGDYIPYPLRGKERRNFFEMTTSFFIPTEIPALFPFFELGVHINSIKVLSSALIVEGVEFNMINYRGAGVSYDPGIEYAEIDPHLGGIGYGFMAGLGVRLAFNRWAAIEPVVQVNLEKVNFSPPYGKMRLNYNFMVRLVVSDGIFSRKE